MTLKIPHENENKNISVELRLSALVSKLYFSAIFVCFATKPDIVFKIKENRKVIDSFSCKDPSTKF